MQKSEEWAGYRWLSQALGVEPVQPFQSWSAIGSSRHSRTSGDVLVETYPAHYRPQSTLRSHLTFALKHEGIHLDFLSRLFKAVGPEPIAPWVREEPTGAYARRCGFLYEWMTDSVLDGVEDASGNYVDLLEATHYLSATVPDKVRRWRINNNLPGTRDFCPMIDIRRLDPVDPAALRAELDHLIHGFGQKTIERAVIWLAYKESKASFVIESEATEVDRISRLAQAMSQHCGRIDSALTDDGMLLIQRAIMGNVLAGTRLGLRRSPVFVGHTNSSFEPVIDYLAPPYEHLPRMMDGVRALEQRTRGQNPILRAAALSFGFVYIHPLGDGNGRLSRFLINDILRRDGFLPAPVILPVSTVIGGSATRRAAYDAALEHLSRPLMAAMSGARGGDAAAYKFGPAVRYDDGVVSNLHVADWTAGLSAWRYPDLTRQSAYLAEVVRDAIRHGLRDEAVYLYRYDEALSALKALVECRDEDYAAIIRSIVNHTRVNNKLRKAYPVVFGDEDLSGRIEQAVLKAFDSTPDGDLDDESNGDQDPGVAPR